MSGNRGQGGGPRGCCVGTVAVIAGDFICRESPVIRSSKLVKTAGVGEAAQGALPLKASYLDFPGGPVFRNLPADAGDVGSVRGPARPHMARGSWASARGCTY